MPDAADPQPAPRWRRRWLALFGCALLTILLAEWTDRLGHPAWPGELAGRASLSATGAIGFPDYVVRGPLQREGGRGLPERSVVLRSQGNLVLDLGDEKPLAGVLVQAGQGGRFAIEVSVDGTSWKQAGSIEPSTLPGFRSRAARIDPPERARMLRVRSLGRGPITLTALRVYAQLPEGWPADLQGLSEATYPWLGMAALAWMRLAVAALGALALLAIAGLHLRGPRDSGLRRADALLVTAGLLALLCRFDFFQMSGHEFNRAYHNHWEFFHYYLGSKYAPELGYSNIYHCATLADLDEGFGELRSLSEIRELCSNQLVAASVVAEDPARCKSRFTPERWASFEVDLDHLRQHFAPINWMRVQRDHGYNPSPLWTLLGGSLGRVVPPDTRGIALLAAIDPLLLALIWGLLWQQFGTRAVSAALVVWGTSYSAGNFWTLGCIVREAWTLGAVVGLVALARQRTALAGAGLAFAALLRLFPVALALGVGLRGIAAATAQGMRLPRRYWIFAASGVATACVALLLSSLAAGGPGAWSEFASNSAKHEATPARNLVGAASAFAHASSVFSPGTQGDEPAVGRQLEKERREGARALSRLLAVALLPVLFLAVRREPDWVAALLGLCWIPFATEASSYYYAYLALLALIVARDPGSAAPLALYTLAAAILGVVYDDSFPRAPFVWASYLSVLLSLWLLVRFARSRDQGAADSSSGLGT